MKRIVKLSTRSGIVASPQKHTPGNVNAQHNYIVARGKILNFHWYEVAIADFHTTVVIETIRERDICLIVDHLDHVCSVVLPLTSVL
jgi:hypothetical protein